MLELLGIMRRLRAPDGCPWDREQTHASLRPYLLEEAAETVDAITGEQWAELPGELGDVLLQVAFHSVIGEEEGRFSYAEVERSIVQKLVRRHPHIFAGVVVSGAAEVNANWEAIKVQERGGRERQPGERVPSALGALAREAASQKLLNPEPNSIQHALDALTPDEGGVARLLSAAVAYAREHGIDPELALRAHTAQALEAADAAHAADTQKANTDAGGEAG